MKKGAISYAIATPIQQASSSDTITAYNTPCLETQAIAIVDVVRDNIAQEKSIAILVRSRNQLSQILPALRLANIAVESVDLDPLYQRPMIQNLFTLVKAMLNPLDKLSVCALLHSTWVGLTLKSIEKLSVTAEKTPLYRALRTEQAQACLDNDEKQRLLRFNAIFKYIISKRQRQSLYQRVFDCFELLNHQSGAEQSTQSETDLFWSLLEQEQSRLDLSSLSYFETKLKTLYSKPNAQSLCHIMTIHKSKGLEFDTVIMPGIEKSKQPQDQSLLQWMEVSHAELDSQLLLAPIKSIYDDNDPIYQYVSYLDKQKEAFEQQRLLYVALTRAKKNILLFTTHSESTLPKNASFLSQLSPELIEYPLNELKGASQSQAVLTRFPSSAFSVPLALPSSKVGYQGEKKTVQSEYKRLVGIFIHEKIEQLALGITQGKSNYPSSNWQAQLNQQGIYQTDLINKACNTCHKALSAFIEDPTGQWIVENHPEADNELSLFDNEQQYIIDRTFVCNDVRWIIDYKLGDSNNESYLKQLKKYKTLVSKFDNRTIKMALYYPLKREFIPLD